MKIEKHIQIRDLFICLCFQSAYHTNIHPNSGRGTLSEAVYIKQGSSLQSIEGFQDLFWGEKDFIIMKDYYNKSISYKACEHGVCLIHFNSISGENCFTVEMIKGEINLLDYKACSSTIFFCVEKCFYVNDEIKNELDFFRLVKDGIENIFIPSESVVIKITKNI